jgi:putative phosphoesterase
MLVGVIADTHGLLRPEAFAALRGCEHLIHAGDVGAPEILERLRELAPVTAVRGNVDHGPWADLLPEIEVVELAAVEIYVLHNLKLLDLDPAAGGFGCVISGHTHQPKIERRNSVLYLNPGSAGPRRFRLPVTIAHLSIENGAVSAEISEIL